jgi:hypothetical protein
MLITSLLIGTAVGTVTGVTLKKVVDRITGDYKQNGKNLPGNTTPGNLKNTAKNEIDESIRRQVEALVREREIANRAEKEL